MVKYVLFGGGLALTIELWCCLFRFGFGFRARALQRRLIGIRVHHGYVGIAILPTLFLLPEAWRGWATAAAAALIVSDLVHHLVVLKLATGKFD